MNPPNPTPAQSEATGTPRTDEAEQCPQRGSLAPRYSYVPADFARTLERELAQVTAERDKAVEENKELKSDVDGWISLLMRVTGSLGLIISGANPKAVGHVANYNCAKSALSQKEKNGHD